MKIFSFLLSFFFIRFSSFADKPEKCRGAVCFTFDDYGGENWLKADVLFKKYNAHATFLVANDIIPAMADVMKKLQQAGHSVGLHTQHHLNADPLPESWDIKKYIEKEVMPQLEACQKYDIKVRSFAYPNNLRNEKTDQELFQYFDYLRAGFAKDQLITFTPLAELQNKMVLRGIGIGEYYKSDLSTLKKLLTQAHEQDALIVFFSHNIEPGAKHVHMPTEILEALLEHASKLNMHIVGTEELPELQKKYNK